MGMAIKQSDEISFSVSYPRQFKNALSQIIEHFHAEGMRTLPRDQGTRPALDGKYLFLNEGVDSLEFRLIEFSGGKLRLDSEQVAEALFVSPETHKFPDVNDSRAILRLKTSSPYFSAIAKILESVQDNVPPPPSVHFITTDQLDSFHDKTKQLFAESGQELSVTQKTRNTGQNTITASIFRLSTPEGMVKIAEAYTNGRHVKLRIPQTTEESVTAEGILHAITQPDLRNGPPRCLRSVSETKLGSTHEVRDARKHRDRIVYKATPAGAHVHGELRSALYAYDPESDILKDGYDLEELKKQLRAGQWKPSRADLAKLHFQHSDVSTDTDRELNALRKHRRMLYGDPAAIDDFSNITQSKAIIPSEVLRKAVEMFRGRETTNKGRG